MRVQAAEILAVVGVDRLRRIAEFRAAKWRDVALNTAFNAGAVRSRLRADEWQRIAEAV
ncbi:hypothetical protein [Solihabitans fulvus]|uniref:hypothetical protein n=1 Tax=Solihabitans fulvus TaxID=1892852 RepID=UPI001661ED89|nr:hypothetical protein [Solihabitans fulvus]